MNEKKLFKERIKSYCKKHNLKVDEKNGWITTKKGLVLYEMGLCDDTLFNEKALNYITGLNDGLEWGE